MIAARKEADIKYQAFLDNDKVDVNFAKLEYVYKSYISLLDRIESISKLMGERQFLTELHFIGPIFPLNAHEKYHEISDRIQKEVSDFFKDSKIFLNDFTRFYLSEIGKDDKRGITPKSFGSCLATVYKGNIIKNLIMDCQSYTKYRPNETTGGIFVSWRRKEELPTGA